MIASQTPPELVSDLKFDPKSAIYAPLGAASPFWLFYAGAASAGVAYWWFSRWREATNLEALFAVTPSPPGLEAAPAALSGASAPALAAEPAPEPAFVAASEVLPDAAPMAEAEPEVEPEPVMEAAPEPASPKPKSPRAARPVSDDLA